jgi:hypothetical protein
MRRLIGRAPGLLGRWWLPLATIVLALLLVSPSLGIGPMGDDYMLMARVDPRQQAPGFAYAPFDLFTFVSGDPSQRAVLLEEGVFGWWMAPDFRMSFWRPFSSLTHVLDHLLWPRSWVLAHAHSMLWFAALLAVLATLYQRFRPPWIAHLALLLYALDDARGWVLGWVANRNVLVAATLAFAALVAHDRARRDGWRPGLWLGPSLFGAALLGGEAALGLTGYLLAHALFIDSGPRGRRLVRLWPYVALAAVWLVAYKALGYGTSGGSMYLNPLDEPLEYLHALAERLPVLLAAQVGPGLADAWLVLPAAARPVAWALVLFTLALFAATIAPAWRRLPECRFWTVGAVLSLPPMCATYPMDRLLVFAGVGAMAAIALVLAEWLEGKAPARRRAHRAVVTGGVLLLCLLHLALAPLLLPLRVLAVGYLARMGGRLETSIPTHEAIRGKSLVILSSAAEMTTFPPWMQRQVSGVPRPARMRVLATCFAKVHVARPDARTLRVQPEQGYLDNDWLRMVRGLSRPFRPGDEVVLSDMRARVRAVTADGRPAEVDFTFAVPLEEPSLLWMRLQAGGALVPWSPPAVGESQLLPSVAPLRSPGTTGQSAAP